MRLVTRTCYLARISLLLRMRIVKIQTFIPLIKKNQISKLKRVLKVVYCQLLQLVYSLYYLVARYTYYITIQVLERSSLLSLLVSTSLIASTLSLLLAISTRIYRYYALTIVLYLTLSRLLSLRLLLDLFKKVFITRP